MLYPCSTVVTFAKFGSDMKCRDFVVVVVVVFKKYFSVYINGNNENFSFKTEKLVFDRVQKKLIEKPKA